MSPMKRTRNRELRSRPGQARADVLGAGSDIMHRVAAVEQQPVDSPADFGGEPRLGDDGDNTVPGAASRVNRGRRDQARQGEGRRGSDG